jgi:hypothetical protein
MKILLSIMAMFLLTAFSSCSSSTNNTNKEFEKPQAKVSVKTNTNDDVVYGEYLVLTISNPNLEKIRSVFKPLDFKELKSISHNVIKIKFDKDPGLKELEAKIKRCKDIKSIEPNRIVRIPRPVR